MANCLIIHVELAYSTKLAHSALNITHCVNSKMYFLRILHHTYRIY